MVILFDYYKIIIRLASVSLSAEAALPNLRNIQIQRSANEICKGWGKRQGGKYSLLGFRSKLEILKKMILLEAMWSAI